MSEYYLSRLELNARKRGARKLLTSPQAMHAAVEASLPVSVREPSRRFLWRVDRHGIRNDLYVVSPGSPDFSHIVEQAGWQSENRPGWKSRPYARLLDRLQDGQMWAFRLAANPVHMGKDDYGTPKRFGHVTVDQQLVWLLNRTKKHGFGVADEVGRGPAVDVVARADLRFSRGDAGRQVTIRQATYEGVLEITDVEAFRSALVNGIGRAKAYGCGLLTVAPIPVSNVSR